MTKVSDVAHSPGPPAYTGHNFTHTTRSTTPAYLDPGNVQLPRPFIVAITGGGRGLGEAYAIAYAQASASHIFLAARSSDELEAVARKVKEVDESVKVTCVTCNVTSEKDVENLRRKVVEEAAGRLDVLVNNAGFLDDAAGWASITSGNPEDFRRTFDVNVFGVYLVTRTLLPLLLGMEGGAKAVVGISSMSSHFASYSISMAMSKLVMNRFIEFLGKEYEGQGLCAFALQPGGVATKMSTSEGVPKKLHKCSETFATYL